jgi:molecular chaperone GrpE
VAEGKGKPEKINIDHIFDGEQSGSDDDAIEIVSEEGTPGVASGLAGDDDGEGGSPGTRLSGDGEDSSELADARREIEELKDQYMRARADFENLRKRVERDRIEERDRLAAGIIGEILPALDNMDRAMEQQGDDEAFREGVALIRRQLDEAMKKLGVEAIEALGEPFDPVYHEAITAEQREGFAHNTIIEEIRKGYTLGGRVIRPSLVKVVISPPTAQTESPGETGEADGQDHRD